MTISKEVRTGLLVTISVAIFFIGYYFLKGSSLFSNSKEYYCYYANVDGLQNSANVQIRGMNVGHVSEMRLADSKGVKVTLTLTKSIDIPVGTVATLEATDLLGTKVIRLELGPGPGMMAPGVEITAKKNGGVVDGISSELTPRLHELKVTIAKFDSVLGGINALIGGDNQKTITAALLSIKVTADNLAVLSGTLSKESTQITAILHNANSFTASLAQSNDTIKHILSNFNQVSKQLASAPIQKTVADLQGTITQFKGIAEKINSGQGSLGMLINKTDVHDNLNNSLNSLNKLMTDLKEHPSRYINITVFGKKKN
jgi:phospholipid/cholesterol/gamma-HCH transport system substrate-binding protein